MGTMTRLLRPAMEGARRRLRQMQDRVLPDFVIFGAQ